jgi:hypothetical protein
MCELLHTANHHYFDGNNKGPLYQCGPAQPPQDFALNLSAKRCLCNTVGGRIIESCTACCCAILAARLAARSRAAAMTNFARSSLVLILRAFFGGAKSCALVNFFMICPPVWWLAHHEQILPLITAIS